MADIDPEAIISGTTDDSGTLTLGPAFADMDVTVAVLKDEREPAIPLDAEHHNAPKDGNGDPVLDQGVTVTTADDEGGGPLPDAAQDEPARDRDPEECPECGGDLVSSLGDDRAGCVACGWPEDHDGN